MAYLSMQKPAGIGPSWPTWSSRIAHGCKAGRLKSLSNCCVLGIRRSRALASTMKKVLIVWHVHRNRASILAPHTNFLQKRWQRVE
jgi:hypothetical protein